MTALATSNELAGRVFKKPALDLGCNLNHQHLIYANKTLFLI